MVMVITWLSEVGQTSKHQMFMSALSRQAGCAKLQTCNHSGELTSPRNKIPGLCNSGLQNLEPFVVPLEGLHSCPGAAIGKGLTLWTVTAVSSCLSHLSVIVRGSLSQLPTNPTPKPVGWGARMGVYIYRHVLVCPCESVRAAPSCFGLSLRPVRELAVRFASSSRPFTGLALQ